MNTRELDVLCILFESESELTASDIAFKKRELTQSTVSAVLRKLLNAGYVEVTGVAHSGKVLSRTYRPTDLAKSTILEDIVAQCNLVKHFFTADEICREIKMAYEKQGGRKNCKLSVEG